MREEIKKNLLEENIDILMTAGGSTRPSVGSATGAGGKEGVICFGTQL